MHVLINSNEINTLLLMTLINTNIAQFYLDFISYDTINWLNAGFAYLSYQNKSLNYIRWKYLKLHFGPICIIYNAGVQSRLN